MKHFYIPASVTLALALLVAPLRGLSSGVAYTDFANVFTSNQRINAGLGVNVAPGATGTISSSGGLFERSRSTAMGEWIAVTYASGNFTSDNGTTWTVDSADQVGFQYTLIGKTMIISFTLNATSVSAGAPNRLLVKIPGGFTAAHQFTTAARVFDNGTERYGILDCNAAATVFRIQPVNLSTGAVTTYAASTNNTSVQGTMTIEVQ